jgi:hypothetical protein
LRRFEFLGHRSTRTLHQRPRRHERSIA